MLYQNGIIKVATLTLALLCSGCEWENWVGTEKVQPEYLVPPDSAAQLVDYIGRATRAGKRVRMTGSGHSASDVAVTKEVLFTPEKLNKTLTLDRSQLKASAPERLVRVQSGIRVRELNRWLDANGYALYNMGGYDGQTIAGVMMTATHGSGMAYGPMADQVVSMQMVVEGGRVVQIEPSNGITDPARWRGRLSDNTNIRVELIQDDTVFNAARVSIGSMGVVYAVVLKVDQKFWLREVRRTIKWSELKQPGGYLERMVQGLPVYGDDQSPEHWELQYTPYADANGDHSFLITERYRSYTPLPELPQSQRGQIGTEFVSGLLTLFEQPITWILNSFPALAKAILEQALLTQQDDDFSNVSYKVFNIGVANYTDAIAIEASFDVNDTVAAIERSFTLADELFERGIVHTGPIAVRFVKQTDALIAMQQGRDTVFLEIIILIGSNGLEELFRTYQSTYFEEFNSRPHWGLDMKFLSSEAQLRALYPKWDEWKSVYQHFNATGTFDGKVTDRLGISVRPR